MKKLKLTKGFIALVDNEDFERVSRLKWSAVGTTHVYGRYGYRDSNGKHHSVYLHRFILNTNCKSVDHKNGNTLDCRKINLREGTQSINMRNRKPRGKSKFMGVVKYRIGWLAKIVVDGKQLHIGTFKEEKCAALAYNEAAKHFNLAEFSRLNKISEKYIAKHLPSIRQLRIFDHQFNKQKQL